jgi:DinB superfamily
MNQSLIQLFQRDLAKLVEELEAYPTEAALWAVQGEIKNPAGNLALHIVGNLNQYVGMLLGGTAYARDRAAEFDSKGVPKTEMIAAVQALSGTIETVLGDLDPARLEQMYPQETLGYPMTTGYFLIHLHGHLNWHLGQINYHRRLSTLAQ